MARIALRYLWARRMRTALSSLSIVLGVMMIAGTYVLTDTVDYAFDEIFEESNAGIDAVITGAEAVDTEDGSAPAFPAALLQRVRAVDGVAEAEGGIFDQNVAIIGTDGEPVGGGGAPTFGASVGTDRFDPLTYDGAMPESESEVVISRSTAEDAGFEVGDRVRIVGSGVAEEYTLVGTATLGSVESFGGASIAVFTLPEAQRIAGKEGKFDQISVAGDDDVSPETLAGRLDAVLPASVQVETGTENIESQKDDIGEFTGFLKTILLVFAGVALFVASFQIFNVFSITVAQRTREFGMLRALGANRRQIVGSVVLEALLIGVVASAIGVVAGIAFAPVLESLFDSIGIDLPSSGTVIARRTVIVGMVVGTVVTLLSSLIPAVRATRVPPVAALHEGASLEGPAARRWAGVAGMLLTIAGLVLIGLGLPGVLDPGSLWVGLGAAATFIGVALLSPRLVKPLASVLGKPLERLRGIPGRIARENAVRNPGRTASTAAALMIGLALVSFVAVFAAGIKGSIDDAIDKTIAGDLILTHGDGFTDIPADSADAAAEVEGVVTTSTLRYTQNNVEGVSAGRYLTLIDPATAEQVLKLEWIDGSDELLAELGPTDAVIDEKWGTDNGFGVGDTFTATTATGERITYTVRGTFKDSTDFIGDFAASSANAPAYDEADTVTNVLVKLEEGADGDEVQAAIQARLDTEYPTIEVENQQQLKDSIGEQLNQLLGVIYGLLTLALIVSLFGIINTLALSIFERTRELGLLRAVGMSRRQVRRMVRYEAVITAMIGGVLGSFLGVVFAILASRPLAEEGFTLSIPVGTLIVLLLAAMAAGVVAAIGPARRASRIDVLEAVAYE
jgi:putative ABC transport system permease protein